MLDLRLKYNGLGSFVAQTRLDIELADNHFVRGMEVRAKVSRPRSTSQNNLFHGAIEQAWLNQRGGPKYPTWRKLKSWLLVQADHSTDTHFPARALTREAIALLRETFDDCFWYETREGIVMRRAKPTAFALLESSDFSPVLDHVLEIITTVIVPGVTIAELMDMAKQAVE